MKLICERLSSWFNLRLLHKHRSMSTWSSWQGVCSIHFQASIDMVRGLSCRPEGHENCDKDFGEEPWSDQLRVLCNCSRSRWVGSGWGGNGWLRWQCFWQGTIRCKKKWDVIGILTHFDPDCVSQKSIFSWHSIVLIARVRHSPVILSTAVRSG